MSATLMFARAEDRAARIAVDCDLLWAADGSYLLAKLRSPLDDVAAPALREHLLRLVQASAGRLIVDLSGVDRADVNGLAVLMGAGRRATALGGLLRLAAPTALVAGLLCATGLDRQLRILACVEAAVSDVAPVR